MKFDAFFKALASAFWSLLSAMVRVLARHGWLKSEKLDARVISVGNIQVGGAGKTPLVAQIAREANERGFRVAILCRGYGSAWEVSGGVLEPRRGAAGGESPETALCGDEAALLHELAPDAYIGVGADRVRQFKSLQKKVNGKFDLVILDDGFQHWKIRKDTELVAVTSARRTETLFRDWPSALRHADLVIWTKGEVRPAFCSRPHVKISFQVEPARDSRPVFLVTGIGDAKSAESVVRSAGYQVVKHLSFPDHARYDKKMALEMLAMGRSEGCRLAMTGKDWVKWREFGVNPAEVLVLEPKVVFEEGRENWDRVLWEC